MDTPSAKLQKLHSICCCAMPCGKTTTSTIDLFCTRVAVVDRVSDFLLFLGKMMITFVTTLIGAVLLQQPEKIPGWDVPDVGRYWAVPLIMIAIVSFVIASCFMALYEMAINTMFLCFCKKII
jgi:hypothetical protein